MSDAPEWKDMADWSDLPDVYVTKVECQQGMFWRIEACSVPMALLPEMRLVRADLAAADAARIAAEITRLQKEAGEMLAEQDAEYNRKTNSLIKRHADQITRLQARLADAETLVAEVKTVAVDPQEGTLMGPWIIHTIDRLRAALSTFQEGGK